IVSCPSMSPVPHGGHRGGNPTRFTVTDPRRGGGSRGPTFFQDFLRTSPRAGRLNYVGERHLRGGKQTEALTDETVEVTMAVTRSNFGSDWTHAAPQAGRPAPALPVYPLRL